MMAEGQRFQDLVEYQKEVLGMTKYQAVSLEYYITVPMLIQSCFRQGKYYKYSQAWVAPPYTDVLKQSISFYLLFLTFAW